MSELVVGGASLMAFGMGTVFAFLTLLVLATSAMSRLLPPEAEPVKDNKPANAGISATTADDHLLKVLNEAVKHYKNRQK